MSRDVAREETSSRSLDRLFQRISPGLLRGITFENWIKLLRENRFAVDASFWPKAFSITGSSMVNSILARNEKRLFEIEIQKAEIFPPLIILGVWRSGTTFLHNLLSFDERFGYANFYQVRHPFTFLTTEPAGDKIPLRLMGGRRIQDNVEYSWKTPDEDEIGICVLSLRSPILSYIFPRRTEFYYRYDTFEDISEGDILLWKKGMQEFLKKLTVKYHRPLILKSPNHTSRIKFLVEMFPQAKYILIHRDPYAVFQSTKHTSQLVAPLWRLQKHTDIDIDETILQRNQKIFEAFFRDRGLIPAHQYCEVGFSELEMDPISQIRRIYENLELGEFNKVEPQLRIFVSVMQGYRKNAHPSIPENIRLRIRREWRCWFEEWNYPYEPQIGLST